VGSAPRRSIPPVQPVAGADGCAHAARCSPTLQAAVARENTTSKAMAGTGGRQPPGTLANASIGPLRPTVQLGQDLRDLDGYRALLLERRVRKGGTQQLASYQ